MFGIKAALVELLKVWVCYLNRFTTSSTYILYQQNEKKKRNLEQENRGKPAFKLCDKLEIPNESRFKNEHNNLGEIDNQIKK